MVVVLYVMLLGVGVLYDDVMWMFVVFDMCFLVLLN